MRINVRVVPNSKTASVMEAGPDTYRVKVDAKAVEGEANMRLIELLAMHFGVPRSRVRILRGASSRVKVVEIAIT